MDLEMQELYLEKDDNDPEYEQNFYMTIYNEAKQYKGGDDDEQELLPEDFFYQMISVTAPPHSKYEGLYGWWMTADHLIAHIIQATCMTARS